VPPHDTPAEARLVAIGDLHADLPQALAVLRMAGLVDDAGRWSGGRDTLVQTGDTTDRGPDSGPVIELLRRLQAEAHAVGGQVVPLLGNHEVMNVAGDWRYVTPEDVAHFGGVEARKAAFATSGDLGGFLAGLHTVVLVDGALFCHGGVSARFAQAGPAALSDAVRRGLLNPPGGPELGDEGPLWYRGLMLAEEPQACQEAALVLAATGAQRLVMGHTTQKDGRIRSRCGGAVLGIDTGIARHYGGNLAALEIVDGDAGAIYPAGREGLPDPEVDGL
jgi:Calcineurin-like phosphoesterase